MYFQHKFKWTCEYTQLEFLGNTCVSRQGLELWGKGMQYKEMDFKKYKLMPVSHTWHPLVTLPLCGRLGHLSQYQGHFLSHEYPQSP